MAPHAPFPGEHGTSGLQARTRDRCPEGVLRSIGQRTARCQKQNGTISGASWCVSHTGIQHAGVRPERLLVSRGSQGAELRTADGSTRIPALLVDAVDTVGAGDTLNGALAASLAAGYPVEEAARRAVAAASLAVTRAGAREGMPTLDELEAAIARSR